MMETWAEKDIERILLNKEEIIARIDEMAKQINEDYVGKETVAICILKGAVLFYSELIMRLHIPVVMDFMSIASYGNSSKSSGVVRILKDLDNSVEGKHVLVVEDIVDSGMSLKYILESLSVRRPASLRICTLLDKPERRRTDIEVDYLGFTIPNEFVVGWGLDYAERYRNLQEVCVLKPSVYSE